MGSFAVAAFSMNFIGLCFYAVSLKQVDCTLLFLITCHFEKPVFDLVALSSLSFSPLSCRLDTGGASQDVLTHLEADAL